MLQQRRQWADLARLEPLSSPDRRYALASTLARDDGWKVTYLAFYGGDRTNVLMFNDGAYDVGRRSALPDQFRAANQNVSAFQTLHTLVADASVSPQLVEKSLYSEVVVLYRQIEEFSDVETLAMGPLPGYQEKSKDSLAGYSDAAADASRELLRRFPHSRYGDETLLCVYLMTGKTSYLNDLLQRFPNGDRADEARALLLHCRRGKRPPAVTHDQSHSMVVMLFDVVQFLGLVKVPNSTDKSDVERTPQARQSSACGSQKHLCLFVEAG